MNENVPDDLKAFLASQESDQPKTEHDTEVLTREQIEEGLERHRAEIRKEKEKFERFKKAIADAQEISELITALTSGFGLRDEEGLIFDPEHSIKTIREAAEDYAFRVSNHDADTVPPLADEIPEKYGIRAKAKEIFAKK